MGEWAFLGSLLDAVQLQSPLVGRLWLVVMLIFRILVLATVGGAVFEDEQEEFVCNTLQPGCRQTCYDRAFPVSHYRFWLFHILLLSAPPVLFVVYSMHRAGKEAGGAQAAQSSRCFLQPSPPLGNAPPPFVVIWEENRHLQGKGFPGSPQPKTELDACCLPRESTSAGWHCSLPFHGT
ncbi:PREDICTED: gap junction delta-3 protein [Mandrillus leucophaeus]|uniref:gap junction delta-3 protein n=1 Tax=Mandrillus leucophaeus TaxID=9568 RepID=UPI0005F4BDB7|nr:PREDICTED: gap junction delta-3 protein [Mandrillus leucophaeus]